MLLSHVLSQRNVLIELDSAENFNIKTSLERKFEWQLKTESWIHSKNNLTSQRSIYADFIYKGMLWCASFAKLYGLHVAVHVEGLVQWSAWMSPNTSEQLVRKSSQAKWGGGGGSCRKEFRHTEAGSHSSAVQFYRWSHTRSASQTTATQDEVNQTQALKQIVLVTKTRTLSAKKLVKCDTDGVFRQTRFWLWSLRTSALSGEPTRVHTTLVGGTKFGGLYSVLLLW